jgi:hypothetical protein
MHWGECVRGMDMKDEIGIEVRGRVDYSGCFEKIIDPK